jgi:hypothetical protein
MACAALGLFSRTIYCHFTVSPVVVYRWSHPPMLVSRQVLSASTCHCFLLRSFLLPCHRPLVCTSALHQPCTNLAVTSVYHLLACRQYTSRRPCLPRGRSRASTSLTHASRCRSDVSLSSQMKRLTLTATTQLSPRLVGHTAYIHTLWFGGMYRRLATSPDLILDRLVTLSRDLGLEVEVDELHDQSTPSRAIAPTSPFSGVQSPSVSR